MACNHKFQKYLSLERLDFQPSTLVVGTFDPEWPAHNTAEWFYGRTAGTCFWDVLPRLYGAPSLISATPVEWKRFCHNNRVAITALISAIDDADPAKKNHHKMLGGFSDDAIIHNFEDFAYVNIAELLRLHPTIANVYLTRNVTEAFWRYAWNPVAHYCSRHQIRTRILLTPTAEP